MKTILLLLLTIFARECCGNFFHVGNLFGNGGKTSKESSDENVCTENKLPPRIAIAIVGGSRVRNQLSTPYVAVIGSKTSNDSINWYCGGALISANTVVTAAHCLERRPDYVRLGETSIDDTEVAQDIRVSSFKVHPRYQFPTSYNDVAILRLSTPAKLCKSVRPICLSTDTETPSDGDAYVMGWGKVATRGKRSEALRQVSVKVFSNEDCNQAYSNSSIKKDNFPEGILDNQLCAGGVDGGKDACQGDSGGPLVAADKRGVFVLIGIVSSGSGCGTKEYPGIYMRVASYYDWLQEQI